jgi:hypothetical protein
VFAVQIFKSLDLLLLRQQLLHLQSQLLHLQAQLLLQSLLVLQKLMLLQLLLLRGLRRQKKGLGFAALGVS